MKPKIPFKWVLVCLVLLTAASACNGSGNQPPKISSMTVSISNPTPGQQVDVSVNATDPDDDPLIFTWSVEQGEIEVKSNQSSAVYTVPDTSGHYDITVTVSDEEDSVAKEVTVAVAALAAATDTPVAAPTVQEAPPTDTPPPPTDTPAPTEEPTATAVLPTETLSPPPETVSLKCNNPGLSQHLFPQLANYVPFYHIAGGDFFVCEGILHETYGDFPVVRVIYTDQQDQNSFGYFGIGPLINYDASSYREICLTVYADQPLQPFWLKMKDMNGTESGVPISTEAVVGSWHQVCEPINSFAEQGVNVQSLENINLGFDTDLGSSSFLIAKIELRP